MSDYKVFELARMADVHDPDSAESPGAEWLLQVAWGCVRH